MSDTRPDLAGEVPDVADVVIVGGGHNALVAAAYLLEAGREVVVLERMDRLGGWVHTSELAVPGFRHDLYGSVHAAFVGGPVWGELGEDLARHGLRYASGRLAGGASLGDGRSVAYPIDPDAWTAELERLGEVESWSRMFGSATWLPDFFGLLGADLDQPATRATLARLVDETCDQEIPFGRLLTDDALTFVRARFATEELRFLAAPWPLHFGAGPEDAAGALWTLFSLAALAGGSPAPVGGSGRLVDALRDLCLERGAVIRTGVDVDEILVEGGRARGVRTTAQGTVHAREAVIAGVTPDQLYGHLLRAVPDVPGGVLAQARAYRPAPGCLQVNLALSARPGFTDPRLDGGGAINLGAGIEALRDMLRQAAVGLLPDRPVLSWFEPTAFDASRAPAGAATARIQVIGVPYRPRGDAADVHQAVSGWDAATSEAFADRVLAEAELHLPGLASLVVERHVTTPADLAAANPNAGPGDHAGGLNALGQTLIHRPIPAHRGGYRTVVPGLWMTGAATWPGGGITGLPGRGAARALIAGGPAPRADGG